MIGSYYFFKKKHIHLFTEAHKVDEGEYVELYRDDNFILTIPLTHNASKKYGSDAKWCTTKKDCDKDFKRHLGLGVLGYIVVRNNDLKKRLENNAFAMYRLFGDGPGRTLVFDDQNNEYKNGEEWLSNRFDRVEKLYQFYKMLNNFNNYFDQKKETKVIKEAKDYNTILNMINSMGVIDTLKYTGVIPTKIPRVIDITKIDNEKIFEFLDYIASTQSPWITDYQIQPIEMEDDYGRTEVIESFGSGSVDIGILEDEETYSVEYELLTKDVFYRLFKIALFMYGKDKNNIFENNNRDQKSIDQDIFNFLRRRHETKEKVLGEDDYTITVYTITFDIKGEKYSFNNYMSKKQLTYKIIQMLEESDTISLGEYDPRIFDENRQKVVSTVRHFLDNFFNVKSNKPI